MKKKILFLFSVLALFGVGLFFGIKGYPKNDDLTVETAAVETNNRRLGNIPFRDTMQSVYSKEEIDALIEQIYEDFNSSLDPTAVRTNTVELVTQKVVMRTNIVEKVLETYEVNNITNQYTDYHYDVTHTTNKIYVYYNVYTTNNITTLIDTTNLVTELHAITNQYVDILTNYYYRPDISWSTNIWTPDYPPFDWDISDLHITNGIIADNTIRSIGNSAFTNRMDVTGIVCSNVVDVGENAFQGCGNLQFIDLPRCTTIGKNSFSGCTNLVAVNLPMVTSIPNYAFDGDRKISLVYIPSATSVGIASFRSAMTDMNAGKFIALSLRDVHGAAFYDSGFTDFYSTNIVRIGPRSFGESKSLTNIVLTSLTTLGYGESGVPNGGTTTANAPFYNCIKLESVALPSLTAMNSWSSDNCPSFYGCAKLNANKLVLSSLKSINVWDSFQNCGIKEFFIPTIETYGHRMFSGLGAPYVYTAVTNFVFAPCTKVVPANIFDGCTTIELLYMNIDPETDISIMNFNLSQMTNIRHVFVNRTYDEIMEKFPNKWSIRSGSGAIIHCSDGSIVL